MLAIEGAAAGALGAVHRPRLRARRSASCSIHVVNRQSFHWSARGALAPRRARRASSRRVVALCAIGARVSGARRRAQRSDPRGEGRRVNRRTRRLAIASCAPRICLFLGASQLAASCAFEPVVPGKHARISARCGRPSRPSHRVVVRDRPARRRRRAARLPGHVLPRAQSARPRATPAASARAAPLRARRARRSRERQPPARDQRSARVLAGLVEARVPATRTCASTTGRSRARRAAIARASTATDFALDLALAPTQPPLLQGERGFSRKGPSAAHASYYYSEPQLRVTRTRASAHGESREVDGRRVARPRMVERAARRARRWAGTGSA